MYLTNGINHDQSDLDLHCLFGICSAQNFRNKNFDETLLIIALQIRRKRDNLGIIFSILCYLAVPSLIPT